jgi:hypothetical protein
MTVYQTAQEFIVYRNRRFHFVSYEGRQADLARQRDELPPTWFLMRANKRWPVMEQVPHQDRDQLHQQLTNWLEQNIFTGTGPLATSPTSEPPSDEKVNSRTGRRR